MKKGKDIRLPSFTGLVARTIAIILSAALCLSYASVLVNPAENRIPLYFGLFYIPILAASVLMFLILAIAKSRVSLILLIAILPSALFAGDYFRAGGGDEAVDDTPGSHLNILSYNTGMFSSSKGKLSRRECRERITALIDSADCDVVCLQEVYVAEGEQANPLPDKYRYMHKHMYRLSSGAKFGNLTLSKYPIADKGVISFKKSTNLSIYTDIRLKDTTIRIYNNHLESYNISFTSLIKHSTDREKFTEELIGVKEKLDRSTVKRVFQVDTILKHVKSSEMPVFFCGDFNETPMSFAYRRLKSGMKDTFREAGKGFGATYSMFWPLLRIDYILVPEQCRVHEYRTIRTGLSDHYPIISKLKI